MIICFAGWHLRLWSNYMVMTSRLFTCFLQVFFLVYYFFNYILWSVLISIIFLQGWYLIFWHYCFRACPWPCAFFKVSSNEGAYIMWSHVLLSASLMEVTSHNPMLIHNCQVLLLTLQNAPFGLDYERDKKFSKVCAYKCGYNFKCYCTLP